MKIQLVSDHPVTEDSSRQITGKSLSEWFADLDQEGLEGKRRDAINWIYGQIKDPWWPTTIWVEYQRAKGVVLKDGRPDGYNICVTKSVLSPISKVYKMFLSDSLKSWFGDDPVADADGSFRDSIGNRADMVRARQNKDLRYRWQTAGIDQETEVEIILAEKDGKTGLTLNHNRIQSREEADGLRKAWGQALSILKEIAEGAKS